MFQLVTKENASDSVMVNRFVIIKELVMIFVSFFILHPWQIRTEVVSWLAESEIPTVEGIEQSATAVAEAIAVPAEVSEEAQVGPPSLHPTATVNEDYR